MQRGQSLIQVYPAIDLTFSCSVKEAPAWVRISNHSAVSVLLGLYEGSGACVLIKNLDRTLPYSGFEPRRLSFILYVSYFSCCFDQIPDKSKGGKSYLD